MATKSYRLLDAMRHEGVDPGGLRFRWRGNKGQVVSPKNEREEAMLEHFVQIGAAERVKAKPAGKGSSSSGAEE